MPCSLSSAGGPIPESCKIWGELMAPAAKTISPEANTVVRALSGPVLYCTPMARWSLKMIR